MIRRYPPRRGRWAKGGTHAWRKQRARILAQNPLCWCGQPATEVHHLVPGSEIVVPDHLLQAVCHKHNPRGG